MPDFEYPAIHPFAVERGAVCEDCDRPFRLGDRCASRLLGVTGGIPVTETVCLPCEGRELDEYLAGQMQDPAFRKAYERACRRMWMAITIPLCIDGREYARRQANRRKRR